MLKFLVIQYMPVRTLIDYLGTDGIPATVFDYAPDMVIPSHMPGEQTVDAAGQPVATGVDTLTRAKTFARNLRTFMTPHSMHYIAQAKQRLDTLALLGKGVPVDPETLANIFDLPNWGPIDGSTIKEKVLNWAKEQITQKAEIAKLEKAEGLVPPEPEGKPGPKPGQPGAGAPPHKPGQGKVRQKGAAGGGRVVVATTK